MDVLECCWAFQRLPGTWKNGSWEQPGLSRFIQVHPGLSRFIPSDPNPKIPPQNPNAGLYPQGTPPNSRSFKLIPFFCSSQCLGWGWNSPSRAQLGIIPLGIFLINSLGIIPQNQSHGGEIPALIPGAGTLGLGMEEQEQLLHVPEKGFGNGKCPGKEIWEHKEGVVTIFCVLDWHFGTLGMLSHGISQGRE